MVCYDAVGYKSADKNVVDKWDHVYKACPFLQRDLTWSSYKSNDILEYLSSIYSLDNLMKWM